MGKIRGKKLLYTLCFMCIMLIDWSRGSQGWDFWAAAVNMTGVVMTVIILSHFKWKNRPLAIHLIWIVIWLAGSLFGFFLWRRNPGVVLQAQYFTAALSVGGLGIVLLCVWQDRARLQKLKKKAAVLLGLLGVLSVLMLVSRMHELWPIWFFCMFGAFYLIPFSERERKEIWEGLANGVIAGFFILQIFAYGFRPYDEVRYTGAYANCNMNALMYTLTYTMLLYKLHGMLRMSSESEGEASDKKLPFLAAFYFVLAAGLLNFVLFTMTRTAMFTVALVTFVFLLLEAFFLRRTQIRKLLLGVCSFLLCTILLFPCVYLTIRYLPAVLHHPIWWEGEYHSEKVHSFDPYDSARYVSLDEFWEAMLGRFYPVIFTPSEISQTNHSVLVASAAIDNREIENLLTKEEAQSSYNVRVKIFQKYFANLNWTGHVLEEGYFPITESNHAWHAQNVFLQVAFYHGIPAGICLIVLMSALGVLFLRQTVRLKHKQDILALLVWLVFVGYGMLECVWYLGQSILFLMYMVPKLLVDDEE